MFRPLLAIGLWLPVVLAASALDRPGGAPGDDRRLDGLAVIDRERIITAADSALTRKPPSITFDRAPLSEGGPNDFFSMSDYFWPDPSQPDGKPWITRDGQSNPDNFNKHRESVMALRDATSALAAAYVITEDDRYAAKAAEMLKVFFVDSATRMNPRLDYAQTIIGRATPTRGIGLIDTLHLVETPMAVHALAGAKGMPPEVLAGVKQWFADYLEWLTTSPKGKSEASQKNNHAVAYWLQVVSFARLTGNEALLAEGRRVFKETFIGVQLGPDGSFPQETIRTKPYAYSIFQLDNMASLAQLLSTPADNLWAYQRPGDSLGMRQAMAWLYPYLADKSKWPFRPDVQAWEYWPVRQSSLLFGGLAFHEEQYLELWRRLKPDPQNFEIRRNSAITQPLLWVADRRSAANAP